MGFFGSLVNKVFGNKAQKDIADIKPFVDKINNFSSIVSNLSNDEIRDKTNQFKKEIKEAIKPKNNEISLLKNKLKDQKLDIDFKDQVYSDIDKIEKEVIEITEKKLLEILPEAFAVVRETSKRFSENKEIVVTANEFDKQLASTKEYVSIKNGNASWKNTWLAAGNEVKWNMVHYDVQLIGGVVLHQGKISEMATGEGKTLVATLPVYLNALPGKGVHVVTVNDYLAKRDAEWMGPVFEFLGLTIDCIDKYQPNSPERRKAYLADITYGTNNEFGFDYLRDNMAISSEDLVQRKHNYAIVDEVDSVLIDDARTPLIISGAVKSGDNHEFNDLKPYVHKLVMAQRSYVTTALTDAKKLILEGNEKDGGFNLFRAFRGLPKNKALIKYLSEKGNKTLMQKTENYYLQDQAKEMHLVDNELYFVIDEKNNSIELTEKGIDLLSSSIDDSKFFVMPDMGLEIAEIEKKNLSEREEANKKSELMRDYSIKSERVHTMNQLLKAYTLFEKDVEYVVMEGKIKIVDEQTGRIMEGRRYSDGLHQAIEAKENVKIEAATQTFATITLQNYFRMYNKLAGMTGTAETEAREFWDIYKLDVVVIPTNRPIVRDDRNDLVYKTKREKYNAVIQEIEELVNNNRPILVGTTSVEISELLSKILKQKKISHNVLNAKLHQKEADIVAAAGNPGTVTIATNMAGRGTDIKISDQVKEAGGLAIIGTERHDSRRVDRQLRGRAGRQGDPGSSQFFVSLEDNLMRLFGSDRIASLMDRMGLEEGEVIQHSMVTKSIERAQRKVEENNFGIRKRLLEYDDVISSQREVIYKRRYNALVGERLSIDISNMIYDTIELIAQNYYELKDFEGFNNEMIKTFAFTTNISQEEFNQIPEQELITQTYNSAYKFLELKNEKIAKESFPVIESVFEKQSASFQNIQVPFSDGIKGIQIVTNLKEAYESKCKSLVDSFEKSIVLGTIDNAWKEHLRELDDLRQSVQNAVYEQKDPLIIYKFESFELFKQMLAKVNQEIVSFLFKGNLPSRDVSNVKQAQERKSDVNSLETSRKGLVMSTQPLPGKPQQQRASITQPIRTEKKVGRNEPCPCGSGKKYKRCHGR